ncbi:hypothetical protein ACJJTC_016830 [Scirpophaga incertulas]
MSTERPATAPPPTTRREAKAKLKIAATTTPTPSTSTQPQDSWRTPYAAAVAGTSREQSIRDPRLLGRPERSAEKCFDTEHRLLVKKPEAKQQLLQQHQTPQMPSPQPRAAKRPQDDDGENTMTQRITKQKMEGGLPKKKRRGGKGRKTEDATDLGDQPQPVPSTEEPTTTATAPITAAPPKPQRPRKAARPRSTGAEKPQQQEPSEGPVVAASKQRTKAKPATSEQAPTATEGTAAEIVEQLVQIIKAAFISVMSGESLTTVITRGLMELWRLLSRSWISID